jgi:hypothetical protein
LFIYSGDEIENEIGGASLVIGGKEKYMQGFCRGSQKERGHLEDPEMDRILK